jgi:NUDIX domain
MNSKLWNVKFKFTNENLDYLLKEKINHAKNEKILPSYVNVLTGIDNLSISKRYKQISLKCSPSLFPLNIKEVTPKILGKWYDENLFKKPLLSVITHAITYDLSHVIIQQRNNKTSQGHSQFQPSAAGYVDSTETPKQSALREFNEEVSNLLGGLDSTIISDSLGLTTHYIAGNKKLINPLLGYIMLVEKNQVMKKLKVVKTLDELDELSNLEDVEVSKLALVPYENFENVWKEIIDAKRNFGDKNEGVGKSVNQFIKYVNNEKALK